MLFQLQNWRDETLCVITAVSEGETCSIYHAHAWLLKSIPHESWRPRFLCDKGKGILPLPYRRPMNPPTHESIHERDHPTRIDDDTFAFQCKNSSAKEHGQ
jgi:hypothetical protein